jgi:EAL domain-containing protein (putative c-di-GMP-specific phosphodiesterase class I)
MRVLLVDDDEALRTVYADLLRAQDFEVDTAETAEAALERVAATRYDVVLSDIQMPGMGGIEFLKAVRKVDVEVPVVLMTGGATVDTAIEALEYGAFRYLRKPMPEALLVETLQRAARYHALARLKRDVVEAAGGPVHAPADRAALESRFDSALEHLYMAFQPIVACREKRIHAYEALLRSEEPTLANPGSFVEAAEQLQRLSDLGRRVRARVAEAAAHLPADACIFVNLHPADLNDAQLYARESPLARISSRVVLEITERESLHGVGGLPDKLADLRRLGFRLALDDLGAGYAGLTAMSQLEPEYIKLDMSLIRGIDQRDIQKKLVRSMVALCGELDKRVIAEGVEQPAERDALLELGCDLLQGFLFARPGRTPPVVRF